MKINWIAVFALLISSSGVSAGDWGATVKRAPVTKGWEAKTQDCVANENRKINEALANLGTSYLLQMKILDSIESSIQALQVPKFDGPGPVQACGDKAVMLKLYLSRSSLLIGKSESAPAQGLDTSETLFLTLDGRDDYVEFLGKTIRRWILKARIAEKNEYQRLIGEPVQLQDA